MRPAALGVLLLAAGCGGESGPAQPRQVEAVPILGEPARILAGRSEAWVTQEGGIVRVAGRRAGRRIPLGMDAYDVVRGHGSLWVAGMVPGRRRATASGSYPVIRVVRLDPRDGRVVARIPIEAQSNGNRLAVTARHVWISDPAEGRRSGISRIDPATNRVDARLSSGEEPVAFGRHGAAVWSANHDDGTLRRHDPLTGRTLSSTRLPGEPHGLAISREAIWVADAHHRAVLRIDPASGRIVRRIRFGFETGLLAAAGRGGVWVAGRTELHRVDPRTNRVAETVRARARITDFASAGGTLWIGTAGPDRILRVRELP